MSTLDTWHQCHDSSCVLALQMSHDDARASARKKAAIHAATGQFLPDFWRYDDETLLYKSCNDCN